jgi:predicted acylesterase/phospholipase RssA
VSESSESVAAAQAVIDAPQWSLSWDELRARVRELKAEFEFKLARRLLAKARSVEAIAREPAHRIWVIQQLALCTYKDEEMVPPRRFAEALALLEEIGLRHPATTSGETLALGGAVYKRIWEYGGQLEDLHESLALYRAAWERGDKDGDKLYGAVNAAYILDILASRARAIAKRSGTEGKLAQTLAEDARGVRRDALALAQAMLAADANLKSDYWHVVSLAELHLGLGEYAAAGEWCAHARALGSVSEWELQTTFLQLVSLLRWQGVPPPGEHDAPERWHPAWRAIAELLGASAWLGFSCYRGKVGLALSGGGFRASLFHLGVLARLAEADILRSVDVLSTVSGGSIVGAHYYLEVQHLLQTKADAEIGRDDYVAIVRRVQEKFLAGVQRNLRMRALNNLLVNLKVAFTRTYTHSRRLGELYEAFLYREVQDGRQHADRLMDDLQITPGGRPFKPKFSNWLRRARVPVLLLNATSLNSGHGWQFTARWMGEPPGLFDTEVDVNERYRRLWYSQAPTTRLRQYRLGYAVAASACVPGLFEPLVLDGLYPGRTVRLVDGGVHDNQGAEGLLDEACTLVFVSDASGQMADERRPADNRLGVPLRSNSILMDRVREAEYQDLRGRVDSRALQGLFFIHLKKGLDSEPLDWTRCDDPTPTRRGVPTATAYGVDKELQRKLAAIRTDLDSFTEVEAHALMLSGYLMTDHELRDLQAEHVRSGKAGTWGDFAVDAARGDWPFLALADIMAKEPQSSDARRQELGRQLDVSASLFFKAWQINPWLKRLALALAAAALIGGALLLCRYWNEAVGFSYATSVGAAAIAVGLVAAGILWPALKWLQPQSAMRGVVAKALAAVAGWILANVHLVLFDWIYLKAGRLKRLIDLK